VLVKKHALPHVAVIIVSTSTLISILFKTYIGILYLATSVNFHVNNVMMKGGWIVSLY